LLHLLHQLLLLLHLLLPEAEDTATGSAPSAIATDTFATPAGARVAPVPAVVPAVAAVAALVVMFPATAYACAYVAASSATTVPEPMKRTSAVPFLSVVTESVLMHHLPNKPVPVRERLIVTPCNSVTEAIYNLK
jgi:hypothetical protein